MLFNLLTDTETDNTGSIVLMIVLVVAVIALFIWQTISGKKKQKEAQNMVNMLKKGDKVKTIGGVCGYVVEINDAENTFVLETGTDKKKSYVKFDKGAIYQTAPATAEEVATVEQAPAEKKPRSLTKKKTTKKAEKVEKAEEVLPVQEEAPVEVAETPAEVVEAPVEQVNTDKE